MNAEVEMSLELNFALAAHGDLQVLRTVISDSGTLLRELELGTSLLRYRTTLRAMMTPACWAC